LVVGSIPTRPNFHAARYRPMRTAAPDITGSFMACIQSG